MSRKILAIVCAVAAVSVVTNLTQHGVLDGTVAVTATVLGAALVVAGVRRYRPAGAIWRVVLASAILNAVSITLWWSPVFLGGDGPMGQPSIADVLFLVSDVLLAASVLLAVRRRESRPAVLIDFVTIAVGLGLVVGVMLIGPKFSSSDLMLDAKLTWLAYAVADVLTLAAVIRFVLGRRGRPLAGWLLAGGAFGLVASDLAWNWLTLFGSYVPGGWADLGWAVEPLLIGLAAMHPSMRALGGRASEEETSPRRSGAFVLAGVLLVGPSLPIAYEASLGRLGDSPGTLVAMLAGGVALSLLVVTRFFLVINHASKLSDALARALGDRDRLLAQTRERYRTVVEQLPGVVYVVETSAPREFVPLYIGPQCEEILGFTQDEWMADHHVFLDHVHPDDLDLLLDGTVTEDGQRRPVTEFRYRRSDGREIWLRDNPLVQPSESGGVLVQGLLFDVTDSKAAEADRERMEMERRLAQKLEAVGELAAGIAHEINTPVQFVGDTLRFLDQSFTDVMRLVDLYGELERAAAAGDVPAELLARVADERDECDLDYMRERVPAGFQRAEEGVARVGRIVAAMRSFAHPGGAERGPVDINEAIESTLLVASNEYKYVAEVDLDLNEIPPVVCDRGDINQVFLNLVVNAAHAIADVVGDSGERGRIGITTIADGDWVRILVSDTGCGIPDEIRGRVYDPFFTTKEVGEGTGQGLSIARTIVKERHGGMIAFDSTPGAGTTFHVVLPVAGAGEERLAA